MFNNKRIEQLELALANVIAIVNEQQEVINIMAEASGRVEFKGFEYGRNLKEKTDE